MLKFSPLFVGLLRRLVCVTALSLPMTAALAAPDFQSDPVVRFLAEKGLIDVPAPGTVIAPSAGAETPFVQRFRDGASDMVLTAMNFLGVPYRRGGQSADSGFDCSGFTRHIFEMSVGLVLPRRADEQAKAPGLVAIKREDLKPGDLVFFNTLRRTFSHVGIYVGEGKFIHAPRPGGEVRVEDMDFAYWKKRFTGARRADGVSALPTTNASLPSDLTAPAMPTVDSAIRPIR